MATIYGDLPDWLRDKYGKRSVFELDLGRYISLEDGIGLDDISRALDNALRTEFRHLLQGTFHVIIHSTGALVVRNWVRKFAGARQPIRNLIYLAGANFGSGWAHVGKGRVARWGREVWTAGEAGVRVLDALELGASETIDMHLGFLAPDEAMDARHGIREFVIIGSQASETWFPLPVRFAKEDGSDGVVRVCGSNLNFIHARFVANSAGRKVTAREVKKLMSLKRLPPRADFYDLDTSSFPGTDDRPRIPFAIPYDCAHSGEELGIVYGKANRDQLRELLEAALETENRVQWQERVGLFARITEDTYRRAAEHEMGRSLFARKNWTRQEQYDGHSQVILRLLDQDAQPIRHFDVFFGRATHAGSPLDLGSLIEHRHRNRKTDNVTTFYMRTTRWDREEKDWRSPFTGDLVLGEGGGENGDERIDTDTVFEITAREPETEDIQYVPFRHQMTPEELATWIRPHATTVLDIELLRIPARNVFRIFRH